MRTGLHIRRRSGAFGFPAPGTCRIRFQLRHWVRITSGPCGNALGETVRPQRNSGANCLKQLYDKSKGHVCTRGTPKHLQGPAALEPERSQAHLYGLTGCQVVLQTQRAGGLMTCCPAEGAHHQPNSELTHTLRKPMWSPLPNGSHRINAAVHHALWILYCIRPRGHSAL
jgi:hypothetical protein